MSKPVLTKNARWICVLVESTDGSPLSIPTRTVHNIERFKWSVPEREAIADSLRLSVCQPIATYIVDVDLIKYQKDWMQVSNMAINYFKSKDLLDKDYPLWHKEQK